MVHGEAKKLQGVKGSSMLFERKPLFEKKIVKKFKIWDKKIIHIPQKLWCFIT